MNLREFLDRFDEYNPTIHDTFCNEWHCYKSRGGITRTFYFSSQAMSETNVALTFVDDEIVEGTIGFRDCQIIFVDPDWQYTYKNECAAHHVDMNGTKNVWEFGDYIPNVYLDLTDFMKAMESYCDQCTYTIYPKFYQHDKGVEETCDAVNEEPYTNYKVKYTVTLEYNIKAVNMDSAKTLTFVVLNEDLCEFFDNDRIQLVERAVIETLGE